jgi:hypothetical protein
MQTEDLFDLYLCGLLQGEVGTYWAFKRVR